MSRTWWLFRLERGGMRFVVPVLLFPPTTMVAAVTRSPSSSSTIVVDSPSPSSTLATTDSAPLWESFVRIALASALSVAADALVAEVICGATSLLRRVFLSEEDKAAERRGDYDCRAEDNGRDEEERRLALAAAIKDADKQRNLMERRAKISARKEQEKNGLVVVRARYRACYDDAMGRKAVNDDDEDDDSSSSMDVTTQLQFWVSESSTLRLPAGSKRHMLGFYNVLMGLSAKNDNEGVGNGGGKDRSENGWWRSAWDALMADTEKKNKVVVVLSVRYMFGGKLYEITVRDKEVLELPSPFAKEIAECGVASTMDKK